MNPRLTCYIPPVERRGPIPWLRFVATRKALQKMLARSSYRVKQEWIRAGLAKAYRCASAIERLRP